MSLDEFARRLMNSTGTHESDRKDIEALLTSHLVTGGRHEQAGELQGAIAEYTKEHSRPIHSDIDAEIVQTSYWHVGTANLKLGCVAEARAAFEKSLELWDHYQLGTPPHCNLAELLISEGKLDEAIEICQMLLRQVSDPWTEQLVAKALALKGGETES